VFSVVRAVRIAAQRWSKQISAAVNQHATTGEAVFSVGFRLRLYNKNLAQLETELSRVPVLSVAARK
jgi:hypothetical protein